LKKESVRSCDTLPVDTVPHPTRLHYSSTSLLETGILHLLPCQTNASFPITNKQLASPSITQYAEGMLRQEKLFTLRATALLCASVRYATNCRKVTHNAKFTSVSLFEGLFVSSSPGRPKHRWEDNIESDIQEISWRSVDWINLAQNRDTWRAVVNSEFFFNKMWKI
jgi:hypothetical protein